MEFVKRLFGSPARATASRSQLRVNATQATPKTTTICGAGQYNTLFPPQAGNGVANPYNPTSSVITQIRWINMKDGNGCGGIEGVWWCDYWNAGTNPQQYSVTGQWGTSGGQSAVITTAPLGYAISGLAWNTQAGGAGLLNIQVFYSFLCEPGVASPKPDLYQSYWPCQPSWQSGAGANSTWYTGNCYAINIGALVGGQFGVASTPILSPVFPPGARGAGATSFLNQFGLNWWPDTQGNWGDGAKAIFTVTYIELSAFFAGMYGAAPSWLAGCCMGLYANQDVSTAACQAQGLTNTGGQLSVGCDAAVQGWCGSNIADPNCQAFLTGAQGAAWDSTVNSACGVAASQTSPASAAFCSCYKPLVFDSSVPASLQAVLKSSPQCASSACSAQGYKNASFRQPCSINVQNCLTQTTNNISGSQTSSPITVSAANNCQQTVNAAAGVGSGTAGGSGTGATGGSGTGATGGSGTGATGGSGTGATGGSGTGATGGSGTGATGGTAASGAGSSATGGRAVSGAGSSATGSSATSLSTNEKVAIGAAVLVLLMLLVLVLVLSGGSNSKASSGEPAPFNPPMQMQAPGWPPLYPQTA